MNSKSFLILMAWFAPVVVVRAQSVPEWHLKEEWRVGGDPSGGHSFDANMGFGLLPNGGFVHLDYKSYQLHFLDAKGKILKSVGRKGGGPGEFSGLKGLTVLADGRVVVFDFANGMLFFSPDGAFLKSVRPAALPGINGAQWRATIQPDGRVLDLVSLMPSLNNGMTEGRILWAADFSKYDLLPPRSCGAQGAPPPPSASLKDSTGKVVSILKLPYLAPEAPIAYGTDGMVWEPVPNNSKTFVRHSLFDCKAVAQVAIAGMPAPMNGAVLEYLAGYVDAEAKRWHVATPKLPPIPKEGTWYVAALSDQKGNLWVERVANDVRHLQVDIFSTAGKQIGTIPTKLPELSKITDTHVYGFVSDEDGVRYLASYLIVR